MIGIYKITNIINNKCYIGQSVCIEKRWENHKCKNGNKDYPLYRAFRKYGIDNFVFEVLEECSKDDLSERELFYIKQYDSVNNGYNQTYNTVNPLLDDNIRYKAVRNMTIQHNTVEYRQKQSNITKELWGKPQYREKVINKINSADSKSKISKKSKEMWENEEYRNKIRKSAKLRANTKEFKENKSKEIKLAWERGCYDINKLKECQKKHVEKMKSDSEYRNKIVLKMKENKPNAIAVNMLDKDTKKIIKTFDKLMSAAEWIRNNTKYIKADYSTINKVCKGRGKTAYGFIWEYAEP